MAISDRILAAIDRESPALCSRARSIHQNPELRFQEHKASAWLCADLETAGIGVERGVGGMSTAFRACVGKPGGTRVAILAEYDALPEIGHACGHNLIAAGALGAFLGLASVRDELAG